MTDVDRMRLAADALDSNPFPVSTDPGVAALLRAVADECESDDATGERDHHPDSLTAALDLAGTILGSHDD